MSWFKSKKSRPRYITIGDFVYLKSGGPKMTVNYIESHPNSGWDRSTGTLVHCAWFLDGSIEKSVFIPEALTWTDPSNGPV